MNAIEGLWGWAKGLGRRRMAGVRARRERAEATERELLNRILEPVLLRVLEGVEAGASAPNSEPALDAARSELLFAQVMARYHRRHELRHLWWAVSRAFTSSLRLTHHHQSRA